MNQYIVKHMTEDARAASFTDAFSLAAIPSVFQNINRATLSYHWEKNDYKPETYAWMGWNGAGLHVLMASREPEIRSVVAVDGGDSYTDSCMECFVMPKPDISMRYVNIELTPRPATHIGVGEGRHARKVFSIVPNGFNPSASVYDGAWWAVSYTIPTGFLNEHFDFTPKSGDVMHGNFYKCGEATAQPHYGMWQPYAIEKPDYHRPELFGTLIIE